MEAIHTFSHFKSTLPHESRLKSRNVKKSQQKTELKFFYL